MDDSLVRIGQWEKYICIEINDFRFFKVAITFMWTRMRPGYSLQRTSIYGVHSHAILFNADKQTLYQETSLFFPQYSNNNSLYHQWLLNIKISFIAKSCSTEKNYAQCSETIMSKFNHLAQNKYSILIDCIAMQLEDSSTLNLHFNHFSVHCDSGSLFRKSISQVTAVYYTKKQNELY